MNYRKMFFHRLTALNYNYNNKKKKCVSQMTLL